MEHDVDYVIGSLAVLKGEALRLLEDRRIENLRLEARIGEIDRAMGLLRDSQKGQPTSEGAKALACWMGGSDTGASSIAIALATLTGKVVKRAYPVDTADFGRCYRLLKAHPMAKEGLDLLRRDPGSVVWPALIAKWDELTTLYEAIGYEAMGCQAPRRGGNGGVKTPERIAYEKACDAFYGAIKTVISEAMNPPRIAEALDPEVMTTEAINA